MSSPFRSCGIEFGVDKALVILESLSLSSFMRKDFLIITRSNFDVTILDEPYIALMLLYNTMSGQFLVRLWNKTVASGKAIALAKFTEVCKEFFSQGQLCLGYPGIEEETRNYSYLFTHSPIPRKMSRACNGFITDSSSNSVVCEECANLKEPQLVNPREKSNVEVAMEDDQEEIRSKLLPSPKHTEAEYIVQPESNNLDDTSMPDNEKISSIIAREMQSEDNYFPESDSKPNDDSLDCGVQHRTDTIAGRQPDDDVADLPLFIGVGAQLIGEALMAAKDLKLSLTEIFSYIIDKYPFYVTGSNTKELIWHELSMNEGFENISNTNADSGDKDNCYWRIKEGFEDVILGKRARGAECIQQSHDIQAPETKNIDYREESIKNRKRYVIQAPEPKNIDYMGWEELKNTPLPTMAESVQPNDEISLRQEEHNKKPSPPPLTFSQLIAKALMGADYLKEHNKKPPLTYSQLIAEALMAADDLKLQLREIYSHISKKYPFYKMSDTSWKNAVRHNLTLNKGFENVPDYTHHRLGRGNYWRIRDGFEVRELFSKKATKVVHEPIRTPPTKNTVFSNTLSEKDFSNFSQSFWQGRR